MKKIIGFDSWTKGAHHYQRLLPELAKQSIQLTLVHIGSWGNEPSCPIEQKIGMLLTRDIKFYGGDEFERILDIEKPDAVIFLSTQTFAHRALIRYCNQRSIPTMNLYHGLVSVQDTVTDESESSLVARVQYVLSKVGKLLKHTLPCYIKSLIRTRASCKEWNRFLLDIYYMATGINPFRPASDDSKTSKCCVYVEADVEHAVSCYGFDRRDVSVVGNPDFLQFGLEQSMIGSWRSPEETSEPSIMYIDCGFATGGYFFSSAQDFINHLIYTSHLLSGQGFKLCVKLKPHQEGAYFLEKSIKSAGIELVSNEAFLQKLMTCKACIVETTTLAMVPAMVGMPLLFAQYGPLKLLSFGSVLTSYPRGHYVKDIVDIPVILKNDIQNFDGDKFSKWLDLNAGPLPPERMPERTVNIITEMISGTIK